MAHPLTKAISEYRFKTKQKNKAMTLLRVYNSNGHEVPNRASDYRFSDLMRDFFGETEASSTPKVNILEENERFTLFMALPGVEKSDVNIHVEKDVLSVSRKPSEGGEASQSFSRREFDYRAFERTFNLPEMIDTEKIEASMENGILKIELPKRDEAIDRGPVKVSIS